MVGRGADRNEPTEVGTSASPCEGKDCDLSIEVTTYEDERGSKGESWLRRKIE